MYFCDARKSVGTILYVLSTCKSFVGMSVVWGTAGAIAMHGRQSLAGLRSASTQQNK